MKVGDKVRPKESSYNPWELKAMQHKMVDVAEGHIVRFFRDFNLETRAAIVDKTGNCFSLFLDELEIVA